MRTKPSLQQFTRAGQSWLSSAKFIILMMVALAVVIVALTTALLLLPVALAAGIALHLYIKRRLRRAARPGQGGVVVIDGDYDVIDRK